MVINAVSFDYIISNVKSQIAFLKYRTVRQKKRYYTFNPFLFAVLWIYQKCHHDLRLQESSPLLLRNGGCFSLMTNMQIIGSIVCSLSLVSEKTCLHSPSHLCAPKRSHVCLFMLNTMIKMACTNAHFRAEWRKRASFFWCGEIYSLMELETHIFDLNKVSSCLR